MIRMNRPAYLLLGHSSLVKSKADQTVPDGFTIVTGGKCGFATYGGYGSHSHMREGPYKLINSEDESINPLFLQNPETLGKTLLARKLGPLLIEKSGTKYIDLSYYPIWMIKDDDGSIYMHTAGVLMTPFSNNKMKAITFPPGTLLKDANISSFYEHVVFPRRPNVHQILIRTLLHRDKDVYGITIDCLHTPFEYIRQDQYLMGLVKHLFNRLTILQFYDRYYDLFAQLLSINLSQLLTILPEPGVVYSLLCRSLAKARKRSGNTNNFINASVNNNTQLSYVNERRKKNLIRRQIEEAELGRKAFAKAQNNARAHIVSIPAPTMSSYAGHPIPYALPANHTPIGTPIPSAPPMNNYSGYPVPSAPLANNLFAKASAPPANINPAEVTSIPPAPPANITSAEGTPIPMAPPMHKYNGLPVASEVTSIPSAPPANNIPAGAPIPMAPPMHKYNGLPVASEVTSIPTAPPANITSAEGTSIPPAPPDNITSAKGTLIPPAPPATLMNTDPISYPELSQTNSNPISYNTPGGRRKTHKRKMLRKRRKSIRRA
jgi:hypothetical protein